MGSSEYQIEHAGIRVANLEKAIEFYKKNFGFQEIKRSDKPDLQIKLAMLQLRDSYLELIQPYHQELELIIADSEKKSLTTILEESKSHLAISAYKLHSAYLQLKENSVELVTLINDKFFFCRDPDGHLIEVRQSE